MLVFVPFDSITDQHLRWIAESLTTCPEFHRPDGEEMLRAVESGASKVFAWDEGLLVVSVEEHNTSHERRLMIEAWAGQGASFRLAELADDLRRIAAEWQCDTIETLAFDLRLSSAICRIGGRVESVCITLPVANRKVN